MAATAFGLAPASWLSTVVWMAALISSFALSEASKAPFPSEITGAVNQCLRPPAEIGVACVFEADQMRKAARRYRAARAEKRSTVSPLGSRPI